MNDVLSSWFDLSDDVSIRWGLTLLHFLWQGTLVGLLAFPAAKLLRNQSAGLRYMLHAVALLACPLCVALTFALAEIPSTFQVASQFDSLTMSGSATSVASSSLDTSDMSYPELKPDFEAAQTRTVASLPSANPTAMSMEASKAAEDFAEARPLPVWLPAIAQWMTVMYAVGVFCFLIRLVIALWGGQRLRSISKPVSDSALLELIRSQAHRIGLKLVPVVAYCERVAVPTVIGVLRPMILLPATLTTGLTTDELSAILSHELAHIRRYDLWMNLLQRVIESLLFFHPVVWFLSRRLSAEREICCDDLVVRCGHQPMHYAGALLRMAELCAGSTARNSLAIAATTGGPTLLEHRVLRLIQASPATRLHFNRRGLFLLASTLVLALAIFVPVNWRGPDSSTREPSNLNSALMISESQQSPDETPKQDSETTVEPATVEKPASTTVTISGRVELEDGTLVTKPGSLHTRSRSIRSSNSNAGNLEAGRFSENLPAGKISVAAFVDGYAPAWTDEFELSGGSTKDDLVIVLKTGTKKTIRVVDEDDNPVAGATLVMHPEIHREMTGPVIELKTDVHGLLTVEHLADTRYGSRVYATGFQTLRTDRLGVSGEEELVHALKRCRAATGLILNSDGTPSAGAAVLKCIEALSKGPNSDASYYSTSSEDGGWFGQRIATTNTDGRFELDQLNDDSQYMLVIQGPNGSRLVLSDLGAGQVDREITLPERRDLMITVTGDTSPLTLRDGKPFVVIRQRVAMRTATGHGSSAPLGADMPLELNANGGSATYEGLILDPQADPNSAEVEVSLGYGNDFKKTVHIEPQGDTKVTFQLPPAKLDAAERKPDEDEKSLVSADVPIRYPHCVLEIDNLSQRPLVDAIAEFNRTSLESPTGVVQLPITEQETREAITKFAAEKHVPEAVRAQLEEILKSGTLPSNAYFRRFTRFDDGRQMQGVWWVRLVVETKEGPVYSVPVRSQSLFTRPYTQLERRQNAGDGLTLLNRVASYYETPPVHVSSKLRTIRSAEDGIVLRAGTSTVIEHSSRMRAIRDFDAQKVTVAVVDGNPRRLRVNALKPGRTEFHITDDENSVYQIDVSVIDDIPGMQSDALIQRLKSVIEAGDTEAIKGLFESTSVAGDLQEFAVSELKALSEAQIHSIKISPVALSGKLQTWSAWQFYKPNLPVVAFLEIEYTNDTRAAGRQPSETTAAADKPDSQDKGEAHARRADPQPLTGSNRKALSLELGLVGGELRLVYYVSDGEANPPKSLNPGPSISGHIEPLADGTHLITDVITNPGTLLSAHLANEEMRQRDFRQPEQTAAADEGSPEVDSPESDPVVSVNTDKQSPPQKPEPSTPITDAQRREIVLKAVEDADRIPDEQARQKAQWDLVSSLVREGLRAEAFQQALKLRTVNPQTCIYSLKTIAEDAVKRGDQATVLKAWDAANQSNKDSGAKYNRYVIELGFKLNRPVAEMLAVAAAAKRNDQQRAYRDIRNELAWRGRVDEAYAISATHLSNLPKDFNDREIAFYCSSARGYDYYLKHDHLGQAIHIIEQMPKGEHRDAAVGHLIDGLLYVANKDQVTEKNLALAETWVGRIDDKLKQAAARARILQKRLPGMNVEELELQFSSVSSREEKLEYLRWIFRKLLEENRIEEADRILPRELQLVKEQPRPEQKSKFGNVDDVLVEKMTTWNHHAAIVRALHKAGHTEEAKARLEAMKDLPDSEPVFLVGNLAGIRLQLSKEFEDFDTVEKQYVANPNPLSSISLAAWMMQKGQFDRGWKHVAPLIDMSSETMFPAELRSKPMYFLAQPFENLAKELFKVNRPDDALTFLSKLPESRDTAHVFETFGNLLVQSGRSAQLDEWIARMPHDTARTHTRLGALREMTKPTETLPAQ